MFSVKRSARVTAKYVGLIAVAVVVAGPLVYAVLGAFRTNGQIAAQPLGLPDPWFTQNYTRVIQSGSFWLELANSALIAAISTVIMLAFSSLAAFVLARYAFRGRDVFFNIFALGLLFPLTVAILPLYLLIRQIGLTDNPLGVALPQAAFGIPVSVLILRGFFRSIPSELEDAAAIDGCSRLRFLRSVVLPLSRPALTAVGVLGIVDSWNSFLLPLLVLTHPETWTLSVGVRSYSARYFSDTAGILAFTTLAIIPALVFYVIAERQIVRGLTSGAVTGS
jgi:raffinose/stachyose/melibiose transport system permease protein